MRAFRYHSQTTNPGCKLREGKVQVEDRTEYAPARSLSAHPLPHRTRRSLDSRDPWDPMDPRNLREFETRESWGTKRYILPMKLDRDSSPSRSYGIVAHGPAFSIGARGYLGLYVSWTANECACHCMGKCTPHPRDHCMRLRRRFVGAHSADLPPSAAAGCSSSRGATPVLPATNSRCRSRERASSRDPRRFCCRLLG